MSDVFSASVDRVLPGQNFDPSSQASPPSGIEARTSRVILAPDEDDFFNQLAIDGDIEAYDKRMASKAFSDYYGIPVLEAYQNLDMLNEQMFGKKVPLKTAARAVVDSVKAGINTVKIGRVANELSNLVNQNITEAESGDIKSDLSMRAAKAEELQRQLDVLKEESGELQIDTIPRAWYVELAKAVGQSAPYTVNAIKDSLVAVGAGAAIGAGAGAIGVGALWPVMALRAAVVSGLPFLQGQKIAQGLAYSDMIDAGVDPKIAYSASNASGIINQAIEQLLGFEKGLIGISSSKTISNIAMKAVNKMFLTGSLTNMAKNAVAQIGVRTAVGTLSESLEEGAQGITDSMAMAIAQSWSEEVGFTISNQYKETAMGVIKKAAEAAVQAAITAPLLGLPTAVAGSIKSIKAVEEFKKVAPTLSQAGAVKAFKESGALMEGVAESVVEQSAIELWNKAQMEKLDSATKTETTDAGEVKQNPVIRNDAGELRVEEDEIDNKDGTQTVSFTAGNAKGEDFYGDVVVSVSDDKVTIEGGIIHPEYDSIVPELVQNVVSRYDGKEVVLGDNVPEVISTAFNSAVENNPYRSGAAWIPENLSEEDKAAVQSIKTKIARIEHVSPEEQALGVSIVNLVSQASGVSLSKINQSMDIVYGDNDEIDREDAVGMTKIMDAAKSIVYMSKKSNFATLSHEIIHSLRPILQETNDFKTIMEAYGVDSSTWGEAQDERLANELMNRIVYGEVKDQKVKPLIERIASWLKDTWRGAMSRMTIDPRVAEVFDRWISGEANKAPEPKPAPRVKMHTEILKDAVDNFKSDNEDEVADVSQIGGDIDGYSSIAKMAESKLFQVISRFDRYTPEQRLELFGVDTEEEAQGKISMAKERMNRWKSGEWIYDPEMRGRAKMAAGEELSTLEDGAVSLSEQLIEDPEMEILYMKRSEIIESSPLRLSDEGKKYATPEEWMMADIKASTGQATVDKSDISMLSEKEKNWYRRAHEYANSGKKRIFQNVGDFARSLYEPDVFNSFIRELSDAMYANKQFSNENTMNRAKEVRYLVSGTPELKRLADKYHSSKSIPSDRDRAIALRYIKKNEAVSKFLYSKVVGDENIALEAMDDLSYVPELNKRTIFSKPGVSMELQNELVATIRDDQLKGKVQNGSVTYKEIEEYVNRRVAEEKDISKARLKEHRMDKMAAKEIKSTMDTLRKYMNRSFTGLTHEYNAMVRFTQEYLRNKGDISKIESLGSIFFKKHPDILLSLNHILEDMSSKDWKEWSLREMDDMSSYISIMVKHGKMNMADIKRNKGLMAKALRAESERALKESGRYIEESSFADDERNQNKKTIHSIIDYPFIRMDAFANKFLDGKTGTSNNPGFHERKLFHEMMVHYRAKQGAISRRTSAIKYIIDKKDENGKSMYERLNSMVTVEGVGGNDSDISLRVRDLMGARLLVGTKDRFNKWQRESFIYGNLFSEAEKDSDYRGRDDTGVDPDVYMTGKYQDKLDKIIYATDKLLTQKEKDVCEMMIKVFSESGDVADFIDSVIELTGKEPTIEQFYFPVYSQGLAGMVEKDDILNELAGNNGLFKEYINSGMTIARQRNIKPHNHYKVKTDAFDIFFDAIEHQEHLVHFGKYVQELDMIYRNKTFSRGTQQMMKDMNGADGLKYVMNYIDLIANPQSFRQKDSIEKPLTILRGGQAIANLGARITSVAAQLATSPLPFLSEAPMELFEVMGEALSSGHIIEYYKEIESRSPMLSSRQLDPVIEMFNRMEKEGFAKTFAKWGEMSMKGLSFADRLSVAIGWEACFRKHLKEQLKNASNPAAPTSEEMIKARAEAHAFADAVVVKTQPSSEDLFRSPMYQNMNVMKNVLLQFTQPMNVVWQNIRYDIPRAAREREWHRLIGFAVAYSFAGAALGLVKMARGRGPKDDEKYVQFFLYSFLSQYVEAIPFAGSTLSGLTRYAFTGDTIYMPDNNLPALEAGGRALTDAYKAVFEGKDTLIKAAIEGGEAIGTVGGLPVRAVKEYVGFAKMIAGN